MEWILINPEGMLSSIDRARIITRELYNISRPVFLQQDSEKDYNLFPILTHPNDATQAALHVDTQHVIEVHDSCTLEKLTAVFPELTQDERFALSSAIHQLPQITFGSMLPSSVTVRDLQYMIDNGWITEDDE